MSNASRLRHSTGVTVVIGLVASLLLSGVAVADDPVDNAETGDQVVVSVVGDGGFIENRAVPVTLRTFDAASGETVQEHALPTEGEGDQHAFVMRANRPQQGALQRSADKSVLTLGGYDAKVGTASINSTLAPDMLRVVAAVDVDGDVDTSTTLGGVFSERHIRGVVSTDGSEFWVGGHGDDGDPQGAVHYIERGGDSPVSLVAGSSERNNGRVPIIQDDQLYLTSDRAGFEGLNLVGELGAELPRTTDDASETSYGNVAAPPSGADVGHDVVFVDDALYVSFTEAASGGDASPGIAKYHQDEQGEWAVVGFHPGEYWGLTGRVAGDGVKLYTVEGSDSDNTFVALTDMGGDDEFEPTRRHIATAGTGYSFRGVAFAPEFEEGDDPPPAPDVQVGWSGQVFGGTGAGLGAVLDASDNPVARGRMNDPQGEPLTLSVTSSSAPEVADLDDVTVTPDDDGAFTVEVAPRAAGHTTLRFTATTEGGRSGDAALDYRVAPPIAEDEMVHFGMSDASTAVDAGDGHYFVADDDSNAIRLFDGDRPGFALNDFEFPAVERDEDTWDLESSAQLGDVVYWFGSLGNTRSGNVRPPRDTVVATRIIGEGANAQLEYVGHGHGLRDALIEWDQQDAHGKGPDYHGFYEATQPGVEVSANDTLNVEGAEFAPDGSTLYLGFRSPLLPPDDRSDALLVAVSNLEEFVFDDAEPEIGASHELDLEGRAVREMRRNADGEYLLVGGPADDDGDFALFAWDGDPATTPTPEASGPLTSSWGGSWESIVSVPSLTDGTTVRLLLDTGTYDVYGDDTEAQDLRPRELAGFLSVDHVLDFGDVDRPDDPTVPYNRGIDGACPVAATNPFVDVGEGSSHHRTISCLASANILRGFGDNRFEPVGPISRAQAASVLARTYEQATGSELPAGPSRFGDVSGSHADAIDALAAAGVLHGKATDRFDPTGSLTRGQAASVTGRFLDLLAETSGGELPEVTHRVVFRDATSGVHADPIDRLASYGIVQGDRAGRYGPLAPTERQHIASILARALDLAVKAELAQPIE